MGFSVRATHTKISITTTLKGLFFIYQIRDFLNPISGSCIPLPGNISHTMIDCNNKQQKFLFYGIQFFKSNYLHEKESNSFSPEDTTHRTTACIACGASNKARMYYFSICTRILQRNLVKLSNPTRVLPKFFVLQNRKKNRIP